MPEVLEKETAHRLVDELPNTATWDDLMRSIYVRQTIESGSSNAALAADRGLSAFREMCPRIQQGTDTQVIEGPYRATFYENSAHSGSFAKIQR